VYARIVGYYRPVQNWNIGKKSEYKVRKLFNYSGEKNNTGESLPVEEPATVAEMECTVTV
jgi:ribonucleoside-triphosphate reductase